MMQQPHPDDLSKLETLYAERPESRIFTHLAEAYRVAGELDRAQEIVASGLERHEDYPSAHVVHGRILLDRGERAEAEQAFRRALSLDRHNLVALRALGDLARADGRTDAALTYYRQVLEIEADEALDELVAELEGGDVGVGAAGDASADGEAAVTAGAADVGPEDTGAGADGIADVGAADEPGESGVELGPGVNEIELDADPSDAAPADEMGAMPSGADTIELDDAVFGASDGGGFEGPDADDPVEASGGAIDLVGEEGIEPVEPAAHEGDEAVGLGGDTIELEGEAVDAGDDAVDLDEEAAGEAGEETIDLDGADVGPDVETVAPDDASTGPETAAPRAGIAPTPPSGAPVTATMADLYARQGLYDRAAEIYRDLLAKRPDDEELSHRLAEVEERMREAAEEDAAAAAEPASTADTERSVRPSGAPDAADVPILPEFGVILSDADEEDDEADVGAAAAAEAAALSDVISPDAGFPESERLEATDADPGDADAGHPAAGGGGEAGSADREQDAGAEEDTAEPDWAAIQALADELTEGRVTSTSASSPTTPEPPSPEATVERAAEADVPVPGAGEPGAESDGDPEPAKPETVEAAWTAGGGVAGSELTPYSWAEAMGTPAPDAADGPTLRDYLRSLLGWSPSEEEGPAVETGGARAPAEEAQEAEAADEVHDEGRTGGRADEADATLVLRPEDVVEEAPIGGAQEPAAGPPSPPEGAPPEEGAPDEPIRLDDELAPDEPIRLDDELAADEFDRLFEGADREASSAGERGSESSAEEPPPASPPVEDEADDDEDDLEAFRSWLESLKR
ncbi:MAG: tetratricopeptide repeat protein [Gemmatimonadota bacterium]